MESFEFTRRKIRLERKLALKASVRRAAIIVLSASIGAAVGFVWPGGEGPMGAIRAVVFAGFGVVVAFALTS